MSEALKFTDDSFEEDVINADSDKPVLVDFWAEWCGPCKMVGPIVDELAGEFEGKAKVGKVDVDSNPEISTKYGIRSIPSLLIFKNGEVVDQIVGAVPKSQLKKQLEAQLSN
jgi:thioredoxin 1